MAHLPTKVCHLQVLGHLAQHFYPGIYMSNAHGWATGPVSALSFAILGVSPADYGTRAWSVQPCPGDLLHAEGQLLLDGKQGYVRVAWDVNPDSGAAFAIEVDTTSLAYDSASIGSVRIPVSDASSSTITINGLVAWSNGVFVPVPSVSSGLADTDGQHVIFTGVRPSLLNIRSSS
jgi:hypothetical protein